MKRYKLGVTTGLRFGSWLDISWMRRVNLPPAFEIGLEWPGLIGVTLWRLNIWVTFRPEKLLPPPPPPPPSSTFNAQGLMRVELSEVVNRQTYHVGLYINDELQDVGVDIFADEWDDFRRRFGTFVMSRIWESPHALVEAAVVAGLFDR